MYGALSCHVATNFFLDGLKCNLSGLEGNMQNSLSTVLNCKSFPRPVHPGSLSSKRRQLRSQLESESPEILVGVASVFLGERGKRQRRGRRWRGLRVDGC